MGINHASAPLRLFRESPSAATAKRVVSAVARKVGGSMVPFIAFYHSYEWKWRP